jgi:RNA polymerase sigma-70 factor (ECF subfamily)
MMNDLTCENEKMLVLQLRNNEVKAFDALFHKYSGKLYRFSFSLLKNNEDAKEIIQETFFRVWNKRTEIDSGKSFKSFLFAISYNLVVDQLRLRMKDKEFRRFLQEYFEQGELCSPSETDYETLTKQIESAVHELPDKRKQIYVLSREKGLSHKEIAGQLGISVKTVENQINLSLKHIRYRLGKDVLPVLLFLSLFG